MKNYFPKLFMIIAIILLSCGVYFVVLDFKNDINIAKTNATIIGFNGINPIVEYKIDNKTYKNELKVLNQEILNSNLNDTIKIYYNKASPSELAYQNFYESLYISMFYFINTLIYYCYD